MIYYMKGRDNYRGFIIVITITFLTINLLRILVASVLVASLVNPSNSVFKGDSILNHTKASEDKGFMSDKILFLEPHLDLEVISSFGIGQPPPARQ